MTLVSVSLSFRDVGFDELGQATVWSSRAPHGMLALGNTEAVSEATLLSTCNRTEIYAWCDDSTGPAGLTTRFEAFLGLPCGWLAQRARILTGDEAVRHLFLVTVGLDSMVPGEWQIQGQVRQAYRTGVEVGTVGPHLDRIFRAALTNGKRARADAGLDRVRASLPDVGVQALALALGGLQGRSALVIGAGKMARASIESLVAQGAEVSVTARRPAAARTLAATLDRCTVAQESIDEVLPGIDAVVYATAAPHVLLLHTAAASVMEARSGRPLGVLDLGLPRNVEPEVGALPGVSLFNLERLFEEGLTGADSWAEGLERLRGETLAGSERFLASEYARGADHFVVDLQNLARDVTREETERLLRKAPHLDERTRALVSAAVNRAVRKVLHAPTVRSKEAAARGDTASVEAARWLFDLDGEGWDEPDLDESATTGGRTT